MSLLQSECQLCLIAAISSVPEVKAKENTQRKSRVTYKGFSGQSAMCITAVGWYLEELRIFTCAFKETWCNADAKYRSITPHYSSAPSMSL